MLTILLIIAALAIFGVGLFLPRRSKRFQHWADSHLKRLQRWAESLPQPLDWLIKSPSRLSRKVTDFASKKGRQTHKKVRHD
jgi:hypothetical protein